MNLSVKSTDDEFLIYLIDLMRQWFITNLDEDKLIQIEEYVNSTPRYKSIYRKHINLKDICYSGIENLRYFKFSGNSVIQFDYNISVYGLNNIKLIELLALVNYGNLLVKPYPVFNNMFSFFNKNINYFWNRFLEERNN